MAASKSSFTQQQDTSAIAPDFSNLPSYMATAWYSAFTMPAILGAHSLRFASERIRANAEYLERLTKCRSVTDLVEAQSLYAEKIVSDYKRGSEEMAQDVQHIIPAREAA